MWSRHKEQIVGTNAVGMFKLQTKAFLWSLTASLIRTFWETSLSYHLGGTQAITVPSPVALTDGIETTSQ